MKFDKIEVFQYKNWKYKNTAFLIISLIVVWYFIDAQPVRQFMTTLGGLGYVGAFITGILFVSTFTFAPATVLLFFLADKYNPYELALVAGIGSVFGDYLIFRYLQDQIFTELTPLFNKFGGKHLVALLHTPYFSWFSPFLGAILIMSPLPDELGIGLLGINKIKTWKFLVLTFVLDVIGIFLVITAARIIS